MGYQCEVEEQPARLVLSCRGRTSVSSLPEFLGKAYGSVAGYLAELEECPAGPPFAAYYNMDMEDLDVEAGFPVAKEIPGRGDIQSARIPGGRVATCVHVGPYSELKAAYAELMQWVADGGYETTGVGYEFYLNDPEVTPPEELATKVELPVK